MNKRLQHFLDAENITQAQFAAKIHVAPASISHILSGRNKPGFDFIQSTMDAFPELNIEWLINGKGKMYKTAAFYDSDSLFGNEIVSGPEDIRPEPRSVSSPGIEKSVTERTPDTNIEISESFDSPSGDVRHAETVRKATRIIVFYDDGTFQEFQ